MKTGLLLNASVGDVNAQLDQVDLALSSGVDGVFVYDHLYGGSRVSQPALSPLIVAGVVARHFTEVTIGTLVLRVGLRDRDVLRAQLTTLADNVGDRFILGLGVGDQRAQREQEAWGLHTRGLAQRREELRDLIEWWSGEVWVGGSHSSTTALARECGATVNLWQASAADVAAERARGDVTWAGELGMDHVKELNGVRKAGASWAVVGGAEAISVLHEWQISH